MTALRRHSLSLVLAALMLAMAIAYWFVERPEWNTEQQVHGEPAATWPD